MSVQLLNILLYSCVILFSLTGMCTSILVLSVMFYHRSKVKKHPVDYLLVANSYVALLSSTPLFLDMSIHSIYGYFHPDSSFDGFLCRLKSYLLYIHGYVYFYSFLLQGIYRFCHIVYHTRTKLRSFRCYLIMSCLLWINGCWQLIPSLIVRSIDYIATEYHCQFPVTYLTGSLVGLTILFLIPYLLTIVFYICTMCYIHRQTRTVPRIARRHSIHRHLIIFRRLIVLFTFITLVAMQHVLIPIVYAVFGYCPSWAYPFKWFLTLLALSSGAIIQIFMSPILKRLFFQRKQTKYRMSTQ